MSNYYINRMINEFSEVEARHTNLVAFLKNEKPDFVPDDEWSDLNLQCNIMGDYMKILERRITRATKKQEMSK